ncbi:Oidioi.mRNA.OKI2018_I69.chr2.g6831.t1.cds [Oikopleura dioica]|uniref:Oidioi.mRNA.OKI2018_I69.chr2.g6831.t1.cds n=1 Tax=Oikopleura dioica TaxID=34765 RepID=A0ABN7T492_OIKDI|nr:Oidioi.mRNA.OKI2018_I69.chr2.g6831.t1.cds [Oikopleura dioica]
MKNLITLVSGSMAQFNRFGTKEIVRPGLDFGPQRLPGAPSSSWDQTPSRDIPGRDIPGRGNTPEQTSITQTTKEDFVNRPVSRDDFIGSILSTESCGVIDKFADDCRIASCKDEDRNRINFSDSDDIEVGAICRIKCRQVKATRCRCCKEGFIIAKKCPEDGDEDSCELTADVGALYEGPDAVILTDIEAEDCQQRCLDSGIEECIAASYIKLRFNSVCWLFHDVSTRYGDEIRDRDMPQNRVPIGNSGPGSREIFGPDFRSGRTQNKKRNKKALKPKPVQKKGVLEIPSYMMPGASSAMSKHVRANGFSNNNDDSVMMSWFRKCQL